MTAETPKKLNVPPRGLLSNFRYLNRRAMLRCATQEARARRKRRHQMIGVEVKAKKTNSDHKPSGAHELIKKRRFSDADQGHQSLDCASERVDVSEYGLAVAKAADQPSLRATLQDSWEVDSGFCSEASPPASGRSSPCLGLCPTLVVALDCEMVGTGPGGRCSELARCSILDYHGNILYDKYVRPCQPVTDFRTRWSGIQRHHLHNATPFSQAREEVLRMLEGKVVVGHSIYNDFQALDMLHPTHMVRDTCTTRLFSRLAGFSRERSASLKTLASKLLNRRIQAGVGGHCSVEDARATLDLYKLVEGEWERELQDGLREDDTPCQPSFASSNHYMQDEYWPEDFGADSQ